MSERETAGGADHGDVSTPRGRSIIVVGASAGGVEALIRLIEKVPKDIPAAFLITLHVPPHGKSMLPAILSRSGTLPAVHPSDYDSILPGRVYIAPPDHHLLVEYGYVRLTRGPKENGHRPAVDPLFRTAARSYGRRVIGVVLSGSRDDGTLGLRYIKGCGGVTIVQDPSDAIYPQMPSSAIEHVSVDHVVPVAEIPSLLDRLVREPVQEEQLMKENPKRIKIDDVAMREGSDLETYHPSGIPSGYICPDCGGALWQVDEEELIRFRCRVGHAWSGESLLEQENAEVERALWTALRALQEHESLMARIVDRSRRRGNSRVAERYQMEVLRLRERAAVIRELLLGGETQISDLPDEIEKSDDEHAPSGD